MKIEAQVTSLELSKKLKELGVKQESLWYWWKAGHIFVEEERYAGRQWEKLASAFTVAELGEMLPKECKSFKVEGTTGHLERNIRKIINWHCVYKPKVFQIAATEADARAKMLINLIENNLLERQANQQTQQG